MNKAIKYRLYPTKEQEEMFSKTFGCCRKIWNLMLTDKIEYYEKTVGLHQLHQTRCGSVQPMYSKLVK